MLFIETSIFTKQIKELVSDEEYRQLQQDLEPYRVCRRLFYLS